ncbi:MAG: TIGR02757 family protein [Planctomycetota bacterium]
MSRIETLKIVLDELYARYNRRAFAHPDPVELLYAYDDPRDREIAALVASALSYGRVATILASARSVLRKMDPSPRRFLLESTDESLSDVFAAFRHRFARGSHLVALLSAARAALVEHGSLENAFAAGWDGASDTVQPGLRAFLATLSRASSRAGHLLPVPDSTSACKRMHLFLRWLSRRDEIDPGGWTAVHPAKLIVPLDTHMHRIASALGFTARASADARAAYEITCAFRELRPEDPVRYDFCLTRLGIRRDADLDAFLSRCFPCEGTPHA